MAQSELALILCCKCGVQMHSNSANTCLTCLAVDADLSERIQRQNTITMCQKCQRYLNPPSQWVKVEPESPELLSLCLKRVKGLNKGLSVKSAKFIWTEEHSRRIMIEVTIRAELSTGDLIEQEIPLEFTVHCQQCQNCTRSAAKDYWNACVQVRQKVEHKRTLMALEQTILHLGAHKECSNIKQVPGGIDFYFSARSQAVAFVNFLCKHAPCRYQTSQHLKSHDVHSNTYNYKFTFSVEVAPICKNDIVCLSKSQSQRLSGIGSLCIVSKVSESIHLINPITCQICHVDSNSYFACPFTSIATQRQLTAFVVVEIEDDQPRGATSSKATNTLKKSQNVPVGAKISQRHRPVSAWVMRLGGQSDGVKTGIGEGSEDPMIFTRSHLGRVIHDGDTVMGLDLRNCNINHPEFDKLSEEQRPDVILVYRPAQSTDDDLGSLSTLPSKRSRKRKHPASTTATESHDVSEQMDSETLCSEDEIESDDEYVDAAEFPFENYQAPEANSLDFIPIDENSFASDFNF